MTVLTPTPTDCIRLDRDRFAAQLIDHGLDPGGFEIHHDCGFAAAVVERFEDAWGLGAILAPPEVTLTLYALGSDALILTLRERDLPPTVPWPLRQVATVSFDVDEVARFEDQSFDGCCRALEELTRRAEALLPALGAVRSSEGGAA
jgi:hypothetical protein